jgi:hypothetical protein
MTGERREPILVLRATGPATEGGRLPLAELLRIGRNVQTAVERVARVLVGQADSRRPGRKPQQIADDCALEVVALDRGSFVIALDLPRTKFEAMDLGVEAVEALLEGWEQVGRNGRALPRGYDAGVLHSLRNLGGALGQGIDEIQVSSRTRGEHRQFRFDQELRERVVRRIREPVTNERTVEGRLLMADFRHDGEKCRIHPPVGEPITCQFDESLEEAVYDLLRRYVRATGEAKTDPSTGRIRHIRICDIEALSVGGEAFEAVGGEDFWQEKELDQLAAEQGVGPLGRLEDVLGGGAGLWKDDDDFSAFLAATKGQPGGND